MIESNRYVIGAPKEYTPHIACLVSMMNYARITTKEAAKGLTMEELDYCMDENSNSIGALLQHAAAVDFVYYILTFEERGEEEMTKEETEKWSAALELGDRGRKELKGKTLEEIFELMDKQRAKTLSALKEKDDEWLLKATHYSPKSEDRWNNYWKWFHVLEDEINHRGQIRMLRKRLPNKSVK
ncbi:MAG: DinB family protein [Chitinophagales bacterium]